MNKPKLWKYKTGKKKGKLRNKSKQYLSFKLKEYWKSPIGIKRKELIRKPKIIMVEEKPNIIYFVNFRIAEAGFDKTTKTGVYGSLISPDYISIEDAKILIKNALPKGFTPIEFYEAKDEGTQEHIELIMYRNNMDFFSEVLN